jgi:uncharacterized membrane protein YuzA (DUF378 family)
MIFSGIQIVIILIGIAGVINLQILENMNNKGISADKIDRQHDKKI